MKGLRRGEGGCCQGAFGVSVVVGRTRRSSATKPEKPQGESKSQGEGSPPLQPVAWTALRPVWRLSASGAGAPEFKSPCVSSHGLYSSHGICSRATFPTAALPQPARQQLPATAACRRGCRRQWARRCASLPLPPPACWGWTGSPTQTGCPPASRCRCPLVRPGARWHRQPPGTATGRAAAAGERPAPQLGPRQGRLPPLLAARPAQLPLPRRAQLLARGRLLLLLLLLRAPPQLVAGQRGQQQPHPPLLLGLRHLPKQAPQPRQCGGWG